MRIILLLALTGAIAAQTLLNSSYDIARDLFAQLNPIFIQFYQQQHPGAQIKIEQSHGGSSKQAAAIVNGLSADVVTYNQVLDVSTLVSAGMVAADWQQQYPNNASPYYSLPVFLVRKGNPRKIKDWGDLARPKVKILFPNPRTSGNGRYTYLAAWAWATHQGYSDEQRREFIRKLLANVVVFDTGGRGASISFAKRRLGDVLITFEAEALRLEKDNNGRYKVVVPSLSLLADFPVARVNRAGQSEAQQELAASYLDFLYQPQAQQEIARQYHRVVNSEVMEQFTAQFPPVTLLTVDKEFGGWPQAQQQHFAEGGSFEQLARR